MNEPTTEAGRHLLEWAWGSETAANAKERRAFVDAILAIEAEAGKDARGGQVAAALVRELAEKAGSFALRDALKDRRLYSRGYRDGEVTLNADAFDNLLTVAVAVAALAAAPQAAPADGALREALDACAALPCIRMFWSARAVCPEYEGREWCATCKARAALAAADAAPEQCPIHSDSHAIGECDTQPAADAAPERTLPSVEGER